MSYFVYIIQCSDKTLYTGITNDIKRRLYEHNHTIKGAKYTRSRRPIKLVYQEIKKDRKEACKREYEIKKLKRVEKLSLLDGYISVRP